MIIRAATTTDIADLTQLHRTFRRQMLAGDTGTFTLEHAPPGTSTFFADILQNEHAFLLLAEMDGRKVGYVWWDVETDRPTPDEEAQLRARVRHVRVHEDFRERGIASKLLEAQAQHCRSTNVDEISFDAGLDESVHALFARQGFRPGRMILQKRLDKPRQD